jgi:hypothetical protein
MILTDASAKTARIPVRFVNGKFINEITQEEISEIINGSSCELIVKTRHVADQDLLELLTRETRIEFFPAQTLLLANISDEHIPAELKEFAQKPEKKFFGVQGKFVEIRLDKALMLKFRGTKPPVLLDCACHIPSLKQDAQSLNHAYTLISTAFEPHRRSHAGNVFLKVFCLDAKSMLFENWVELETMRLLKIKEFFEQLVEEYQRLKTPRQNHSSHPEL